MAMEPKGPGGVGNSYGSRTTISAPQIGSANELRPNYSEFSQGEGFPVVSQINPITGSSGILISGAVINVSPRAVILSGATPGTSSGWIPISFAPERFAYQLDSGSVVTGFSVDISSDGTTSLGQAFTGTWASSTVAELTFPIMFSNQLAEI